MSITEKIRNINNTTSEIEQTMTPFVQDLSNAIDVQGFHNVEITSKYIPYYKTFLFLLGSKYYTNDQCTLVSCEQKGNTYHFEVSLFEYKTFSSDIEHDDSFTENTENFFVNVINDSEVKNKIRLYDSIANNPFILRIFSEELYLYMDNDIIINDITRNEILELKNGHLQINNNRFPNRINLNQWIGKTGEVNGFVVRLERVDPNYITLVLVQ